MTMKEGRPNNTKTGFFTSPKECVRITLEVELVVRYPLWQATDTYTRHDVFTFWGEWTHIQIENHEYTGRLRINA